MIALIFSGFASMPLSDTMYPRSLPAGTPKVHLAGFNFIWYLRIFLKVSWKSLGFNHYIIHVGMHVAPNLIFEATLHRSLICGSRILKAERHRSITVDPERGEEKKNFFFFFYY